LTVANGFATTTVINNTTQENIMGYETILAVGSMHEGYFASEDNKDKRWFQVMATVDLCKAGYDSEVLKLLPKKSEVDPKDEVYLYAPMGDGDTNVTEDRYGDKLHPVSLEDVLAALRKDAERDTYRRFKWAIGLLESMATTDNLHVILYGY